MLTSSPFALQDPRDTRWRRFRTKAPSLIGVIALHVAGLIALLHYAPIREALESAAPIMVSLLAPRVEVEQPKPDVERPKPRPEPVKRKPVEQPLVTAPTEAPSPFVAPAAQPAPPQPAEAVAAAAPIAAPVAAPPAPVIPPSFNADYLHNPAPVYPPVSRRFGEQGKVLLRVYVGADGLPGKVEIRASSGSSRLDASALETVQRWKFVPARQGDRPVAAWVLVPISFQLQG